MNFLESTKPYPIKINGQHVCTVFITKNNPDVRDKKIAIIIYIPIDKLTSFGDINHKIDFYDEAKDDEIIIKDLITKSGYDADKRSP